MTNSIMNTPTNSPDVFDVVIVGGGAAGLTAAVALGRARRSAALIDAGDPRNKPAEGIHNFLGHDGIAPTELTRIGRAEAERYGVVVKHGHATAASGSLGRFEITTDDGSVVIGRRLLIATGVADTLPDVPGLRERWGKDVIHCPYCHGWEVRDRRIGVISNPVMPIHQALMFRQWSDTVTLFTNGVTLLSDEEREQLAARGIDVVDDVISAVESADDFLTGIRTTDGTLHDLQAIAVASTVHPRVEPFLPLGLVVSENPMGMGSTVEVDAFGATATAGVWVAGNASDMRSQVVSSAAQGLNAAVAVNSDLIAEDTRLAVERYRAARVG